jgi:integrase
VPCTFRHHFAYACIERWRALGKDVSAMLPYLSRYMGHASFDSTYYYINSRELHQMGENSAGGLVSAGRQWRRTEAC